MKTCSKCGVLKEDSEYSWSIHGIKKHSACKSCRAGERLDYYERNKVKELEYKWNRQLDKRAIAREFVDNFLARSYCVDCGSTDMSVLTFDHVRGSKKMSISTMVSQGYSLDAIKSEISKCEVRCFNCHMKIEKERRRK
jgi:hypothetical protein